MPPDCPRARCRARPTGRATLLSIAVIGLVALPTSCSVDHGGIEPAKQMNGRDGGSTDALIPNADLGSGGAESTASGGSPGSGGDGSGGAAMGGTSSGGASTGGMGVGGASAGGAAIGGNGTGGASTGGAGTGGANTGGADTGGASAGGVGPGGAAGGGGVGGTTVACGPQNCGNGCCAGTVCVRNPTLQRCGHGGEACELCGACQRCSGMGACEVDPMSQWMITAVSAKIAPKYPDGSDWDPAGEKFGGPLPDPFVEFEMPPLVSGKGPPPGGVVGDTTTKTDTLSPMWNESLTGGATVRARDLLAGGESWLLWVGDEDNNSFADTVCEITDPMAPTAFAAGGFTRTNLDGCAALTIKLTCQP